jgi:choline dehydrogenase-like flavoprotein
MTSGAQLTGCAVAARLSERAGVTVALLEAGGSDDDPNIGCVPRAFQLAARLGLSQ